MRNLIVEADPDADAELVARLDTLYTSARDTGRDPLTSIERRRLIASGLQRVREEDPERYEAALLRLRRYDQRLQRFGLRDRALDRQPAIHDAFRFGRREIPLALVLVPVALAAAAIFALPYALTGLVARFQRETDITATAKVISGALFYAGWMLLVAALVGVKLGLLWGIVTAAALPLLAVGGLFAIEREWAAIRAARTWLALRGARPATRQRLRRQRADLADLLDEVNAWLRSART